VYILYSLGNFSDGVNVFFFLIRSLDIVLDYTRGTLTLLFAVDSVQVVLTIIVI
jgi:hypothetical protein